MTYTGKTPIDGTRCYIIAEVGINHNGDLDLARRHIDMAADAGVDAVKFQNFRTEDFISDRALTWSYENNGTRVTESQWDMFKRCELTGERLAAVADHCRRRGVDFSSTPTGLEGVEECQRNGAAFIKNGSDYLTNLPLVRAMAKTGLQTVLSTGMASVAEIGDAVTTFRDAGGNNLVLLHCISLYPTPPEALDLRRIPILARTFGCAAGFSDHSEGINAAVASVALGAAAIERHITIDKTLPGPDHKFSADPGELRALVSAVRQTESALGRETLGYGPAEADARKMHRLSCVAAYALAAGTVLTEADIAFRRPGTGLPPKAIDWLVGRKLAHEIALGAVFTAGDFID